MGTDIGSSDAVFAAVATSQTPALKLVRADLASHHRVARAHRYRQEVQAWSTEDGHGLLVLGRGVAGRWEVSFEVAEAARGRGLGRALALAALGLLPAGNPVFAQVAPGNSSSMRAIRAADYKPVGSEVLFPAAPQSF